MSNFIPHIATIEIPVSNLSQSIDFYTEILGVTVIFRGETQAMLSFEAKGVPTLFLVQTENKQRLSFVNSFTGVEHTIIDFYTENLPEFRQWLMELKVEVGSLNVNAENGLGGFGFKDPDGNMLSACNILHENQ